MAPDHIQAKLKAPIDETHGRPENNPRADLKADGPDKERMWDHGRCHRRTQALPPKEATENTASRATNTGLEK